MHGMVGTLGLIGWLFGAAEPTTAAGGHEGVISGQIRNSNTRAPIRNALVILQCTCLVATRETLTNEQGVYAFVGLAAGTYTVQVLVGTADVSKVVTLPPSGPEPEQP